MIWNKAACLVMFCALACASSRAQTFDEWFRQKKTQIAYYVEQISALKAYGELIRKSYTVVNDGLQLVHDIRDGEFSLHSDYFNSLSQVNESLRDVQAEEIYERVVQQCAATVLLASRRTAEQREYIESVAVHVRNKASESFHEYQMLTTAGNFTLSDEERLERIDHTIATLKDQYAFIKSFYNKLQRLLLQQQKEQSDVKQFQQMIK